MVTHFETCDNLVSDDESDRNDLHEMVEDYFGASNTTSWLVGEPSGNSTPEEPNDDAAKFFRLLVDNAQKLYLNCKCTKLSFIVKLLHIKFLGDRQTNRLLCCFNCSMRYFLNVM
jgi:hypothetical protein